MQDAVDAACQGFSCHRLNDIRRDRAINHRRTDQKVLCRKIGRDVAGAIRASKIKERRAALQPLSGKIA